MYNQVSMQDKYINVFDAEGTRWKQLRTVTAPHFTAKSMKQVPNTTSKL